MTTRRRVHGEGNYEATHRYHAATRRFIEAGRVGAAAKAAAPTTPREADELRQAERAALLRAKGRPEKCPPADTEPTAGPAVGTPGCAARPHADVRSGEPRES